MCSYKLHIGITVCVITKLIRKNNYIYIIDSCDNSMI